MAERQEGGESSFKIVDKRRFTPTGEVRPGSGDEDRKRPVPADPVKPAVAASSGASPSSATAPKTSQAFLSFVASLATNALAALGALPEGRARGLPVDPELAREYIEILAVLEVKTKGNLSAEEASTLQRMVAELKLQYVEVTKRAAAAMAGGMPVGMPQAPGGRR